MRIYQKNFASMLVGFFVIFANIKNGPCRISSSTFDLIVITLHKDVKFMFDRPEQMNVDAIFGLNFVQVHLVAALEHENSVFLGQRTRKMLQEILKFCKIAMNDGKKFTKTSAFEMMIRPDIWNRTIFWKIGDLCEKPTITRGLKEVEAASLIYQGTPVESESSSCLVDLLVRDENFDCKVSKDCAEMLARRDSSRGYPLTHRLLYVQTAIALNCKEHPKISFARLEKNFCSTILQDLVDLESVNFPAPSSDLAMEQILLCGMAGYLEFTNEHYANLITTWPNAYGCYSALGFSHDEKTKRERRSTDIMDHGCDNHASGVAAACLSLLVRSTVENFIDEYY